MKGNTQAQSRAKPTNQVICGTIFFDVPVYRLAKADYESQQDFFVQEHFAEGGPCVEEMYRRDPKEGERWRGRLRELYGGCWLFNEIIGFIRLSFYGTQIRGEYWRVQGKRIVRTRKKLFEFREPNVTYEERVPAGTPNTEVFALVMKYLARAQHQRYLADRFVDTSLLEYVGPHVDWNALLTLAQPS